MLERDSCPSHDANFTESNTSNTQRYGSHQYTTPAERISRREPLPFTRRGCAPQQQVTAELEHSELEHAHMLPVLPHQHLETPLVERERLRVGTAAQTAPPPRARGPPRTAAS